MTSASAKKIVIIDDDEAIRDSTQLLLQSCGYETQSHPSADDFLEKISAIEADCLIVDVQMPGLSGIELLETLRARAIATPVILMTANVERVAARGAQAGALAVLCKPFAEDALLRCIALACG